MKTFKYFTFLIITCIIFNINVYALDISSFDDLKNAIKKKEADLVFVNDIEVAALPVGITGNYSYHVNLISGSIDPNFSYFPFI